jgi:hypothetical protein
VCLYSLFVLNPATCLTCCLIHFTVLIILWGCIQKFPDWNDNEINNKHPLRSSTKGYGGKTH